MALPYSAVRASRGLLRRCAKECSTPTSWAWKSGTAYSAAFPTAVFKMGGIKPRAFSTSLPLREPPTEPTLDGSQKSRKEPVPRSAYPDFSLQDKVYVVTGGGRGLGLVIAEAMVQAGAEGAFLQNLPRYLCLARDTVISEHNKN